MWLGRAPYPDRSDVDGASVDGLSLVVACGYGAVLAELVDAAFDGITVLVDLAVEGGWPVAPGAKLGAVGGLVLLDRNHRLDATFTQIRRGWLWTSRPCRPSHGRGVCGAVPRCRGGGFEWRP